MAKKLITKTVKKTKMATITRMVTKIKEKTKIIVATNRTKITIKILVTRPRRMILLSYKERTNKKMPG